MFSVRRFPSKIIILVFLLFGTLLQGTRFFSTAWGNIGYLQLAAIALGEPSRVTEAERALQNAQDLASTPKENLSRGLGWIYMYQGHDTKAIHNLENALAIHAGEPIAGFFLGELYWKTEEHNKAIDAWRQADAAQHFLVLGQQLSQAGRFDEATETLKLALDINPKLGEAYLELGRLMRKNEQSEEAIQELQRALEFSPAQKEASIYGELGNAYRENGDLNKALWAYQETYTRLPSGNYYAYQIASILFKQEQYNEATQYLQLYLQSTPHAGSHYLLGRIFMRQSKWNDAEQEFRDAMAIDPGLNQNHIYHELLGDVYKELGELETAVKEYQDAFCLQTTNAGTQERIMKKLQTLQIDQVQCKEV